MVKPDDGRVSAVYIITEKGRWARDVMLHCEKREVERIRDVIVAYGRNCTLTGQECLFENCPKRMEKAG